MFQTPYDVLNNLNQQFTPRFFFPLYQGFLTGIQIKKEKQERDDQKGATMKKKKAWLLALPIFLLMGYYQVNKDGDVQKQEEKVEKIEVAEEANKKDSKTEFTKKLTTLEKELESIYKASTDGTQMDMTEAQNELFTVWDEMVTAIYREVASHMDEEEVQEFKKDQENWEANREKTAKEAAKAFEGGSFETYQYLNTKTSLTKERSYALVDMYLK